MSKSIYYTNQPMINKNQSETQNYLYENENKIINIQENIIDNETLMEPGYQIQRIIIEEKQNEIMFHPIYILLSFFLGGFATLLAVNNLPPEKKDKYLRIGIFQILLFPILYIGYFWAIYSACNGFP